MQYQSAVILIVNCILITILYGIMNNLALNLLAKLPTLTWWQHCHLTSSNAYCAMQFNLNKQPRYCTFKKQIGSPSSNAINPENKRRKSLIASRCCGDGSGLPFFYAPSSKITITSITCRRRHWNVWQCLLNRIGTATARRKMLYCWVPFGERIPKAPSIPHIWQRVAPRAIIVIKAVCSGN